MMPRRLFPVFLAGLFWSGSVLAEVPDPTRPTGAVMTPDAGGGVVAPAESGVQTVIMRPGGKSTAVINGQSVQVGGKLGDKRVVKISESEVVLRGVAGREVIKVTPAIEKLMTKQTTSAKRRSTGTTQ